ncbi:MAG: ATPase/DNA packaging protein, partial [bacterium]
PKGITVYEELTEVQLMAIYNEQLGSDKHTLILSDDMDEQSKKLDQQVVNHVTNSRHFNLSMIFLVQKMSMVPTIISIKRGLRDFLFHIVSQGV